MKKVIFSAALLAAISTSYAQSAATPLATVATQQDEKIKIEVTALPEPVKNTLAGDAYKGWQPTAAWTLKAQPDVFEIELKNGEQAKTVKFDKDGKAK